MEQLWKKQENETVQERYPASVRAIRKGMTENSMAEPWNDYFRKTGEFLLLLEQVRQRIARGFDIPEEELEAENHRLYEDILPENYENSYANPSWAVKKMGTKMGQLLSFLYTELRGGIAYVFENKLLYLTAGNEMFLAVQEVLKKEGEPSAEQIQKILYDHLMQAADFMVHDRQMEQISDSYGFITDIIRNSDLSDPRYLYRSGEYITENEKKMAEYLWSIPEEKLDEMADNWVGGFVRSFVNSKKDLSKKTVLEFRAEAGLERFVKAAMERFDAMGIESTIYRAGVSIWTKKGAARNGFYGADSNPQYLHDHKNDLALFLDNAWMEKQESVLTETFEAHKKEADGFAGPVCVETFGMPGFSPVKKPEAADYSDAVKEQKQELDAKLGEITNTYMNGENRSFTIVNYPGPAIGEQFEEIFDAVIRMNVLDSDRYEKVQQMIIDALDAGEKVHIVGSGENETDLWVQLHPLKNLEKETNFENCTADVNIPVGEVFTSPVLAGTTGILHVSRVYLHQLEYKNLKVVFQDGMTEKVSCSNFPTEKENQDYLKETLLYGFDSLPMGEFAIGTNTVAYREGRKYHIEDKYTILIAEKTGPHFAVGDTCYKWSEDVPVYNPDGKEVIARDNEKSIRRKTDPVKAYYQCHTDITIPYDELERISVVHADGTEVLVIKDGRFVLPGTEELNKPLEEA